MPEVKPPTARQAKAALTRRRMVDAAYELLCQHGYRATTMDAIAERAGVAVQTLYFTFHTKDDLLQAVHEWTVLGDDPTPPPRQSWYLAAVAEPDATRALAKILDGVAMISARVAPMLPVFHSVVAEPAGATYRNGEALRRSGFVDVIAMLRTKSSLRRGLSRRRAVDILFVLASPESYRAFVLDAGWSASTWVTWTTSILSRELFATNLTPEGGRASQPSPGVSVPGDGTHDPGGGKPSGG